jgi:mono/diheme cytochrome c family protein
MKVTAVIAIAIGLGLASSPLAAEDTNAAYDQYCLGCHGPDARGGSQGADLVASTFVAGQPVAALVDFLKIGRLADDAASRTGRPMPGFAWLSDAELQSVAAFIKSINAPSSASP